MTRSELIAARRKVQETMKPGVERALALRDLDFKIAKLPAPKSEPNADAIRRECERMARKLARRG